MAQSLNQQKKTNKAQNILVALRVRPLSNEEREKKVKNITNCISMREIQFKDKKYHFDRVFNSDSSQMDVYQFAVAPMIIDVLAGYNCTVFAYGQTGTGKTHTMIGDDTDLTSKQSWRENKMAGCIPRAAANIFEELVILKVRDYSVGVSFLELYNEDVIDLLNADCTGPPLNIFNDTKGSVCIQNLRSVSVANSTEIINLLKDGMLKRQTAATLMNNHSSRSHVVFTITVHTREITSNGEEVLKTGKLNLVDLAGSENIAKSGAKDKRAQESANINKSLLTLGRVIQILAEKNSKHVPYRDSKLTRILQDSLGGHTKTCIVATVSPSQTSHEETQNTLEYASRARDVKNTPMINEKITKSQMIKELSCEIERLKKDLYAARLQHGIFVDPENWQEMNSRLETNSQTLNIQSDTINYLKDKISDLETIREYKEKQYDDIMDQCKYKDKLFKKATDCLKDHRISLKQEQYLSKCYAEAANETDAKIKELLDITKNYSRCQEVLHQKLENQYFNNVSNEKLITEKSSVLNNNASSALAKLAYLLGAASAIIDQENLDICSAQDNCHSYESTLKTSEENEQTLKSIFEKHTSSFLQQSSQFTQEITAIHDNKLDLTLARLQDTAALNHFYDYDKINSSIIGGYAGHLNAISDKLSAAKRKKEKLLKDLEIFIDVTKSDILDHDSMLNDIEKLKDSCKGTTNLKEQKKLQLETELDNAKKLQMELSALVENRKSDVEAKVNFFEQERNLLLNDTHQKIQQDIEREFVNDKIARELAFIKEQKERLHSLLDANKDLSTYLEANGSELNSILVTIDDIGKSMAAEVIRSQRVGDTPNRTRFSFTPHRTNGALPRDILLNRFKEEFSEDPDESFGLNVSFESSNSNIVEISESTCDNSNISSR